MDSIAPFIMSTRLLTPLTLLAAAHRHAAAVLRRIRDAPMMHLLVRRRHRSRFEVRQHSPQHDVHFSVFAKAAPMQRRVPPPNGSHANVGGLESTKRDGSNRSGFGKVSAFSCRSAMLTRIV